MTTSRLDQLYADALAGERMSFANFTALLTALGFRLARQFGNQRVFAHVLADRPLPVQRDGHDAKRYQVRLLGEMIGRYGLRLTVPSP